MGPVWDEIRIGARGLRKNPGFTLVVAATLALGIGANAAIFSVVNGVILHPLPFGQSEDLMLIWNRLPAAGDRAAGSPAELLDWQRQSEALADVAGLFTGEQNRLWTITRNESTERITGAFATANLFEVLGVGAALGRTFTAEEGIEGRTDAVVLNHRFWTTRMGADPGAIGTLLQVNGDQYRIVGVMPEGFHTEFNVPNSGDVDLWLPFAPDESMNRRFRFVNLVGRLAEGVDRQQAQLEANGIARAFLEAYPDVYANDPGYRIDIEPLFEQIIGDVRRPLMVLFGAVGLVLLIACVNVANLLLVRAEGRHREFAVRQALGAPSFRLLRQSLIETGLLAALGGALGLAVAYGGVELLRVFNPGDVPRMELVRINSSVLALLAALVTGTGLAVGVVPWLRTSRSNLAGALRENRRSGTATRSGIRAQGTLVTTQIALAVVLVVGAGLLTRSFLRLAAIDLGVNSESVLSLRMDFESWQYPEIDAVEQAEEQILGRVGALTGVRSASLAHAEHPLRLNGRWLFEVEGRDPDPTLGERLVGIRVVSPDHFVTLGQPILRGRALDETDRAPLPRVVVINQSMAEKWFPGEDPVGRHLRLRNAPWDTASYRVVGVAADVKNEGIREEVRETVLLPLANPGFTSTWRRHMTLYVRTDGPPARLSEPVRRAIAEVDPNLVTYNVQPLKTVVRGTVAGPRFTALLIAVFAFLALVLASVGVYGVLSYTVAHRTREIGVRMALGAARSQVRSLILRQGLVMAGGGIAVGIAGSLLATRVLESLLYEVRATDAATYAGVIGILLVVALAATLIPATRATRVEPATVLKSE